MIVFWSAFVGAIAGAAAMALAYRAQIARLFRNVHSHDETLAARLQQQLDQIRRHLGRIEMKEADIEQFLKDIDAETNTVAAKVDAQAQAIADLKAQIDAGTPVTQEQLDGIGARLSSVSDRLKAIGADPAQPIPPVEG